MLSKKTLSTVLVLFTLVVSFGCGGGTSGTTTTSLADPETEAYLVYSAVFRAKYLNANVEQIVIQDQTGLPDWENDMKRLDHIQEAFAVERDILDDFSAQNKSPRSLKDDFDFSVEVVLVGQEELQRTDWETFYDTYPTSPGWVELSAVGFSSDMSQALVYVGNPTYYLAGAGFVYLLERQNGTWVVVNEVMMWVS